MSALEGEAGQSAALSGEGQDGHERNLPLHPAPQRPDGATDHRENSNAYRGEIARSGKWRVVTCRNDIQWILQRQKAAARKPGGVVWEGRSYTCNASTLCRLWRQHTGEQPPMELLILPELFRHWREARGQ